MNIKDFLEKFNENYSFLYDNYDNVEVKKDSDYVWKMQKNFIKARGGAIGLFIELEHIGHNNKIKGHEVLDSVFDNMKKLYGGVNND